MNRKNEIQTDMMTIMAEAVPLTALFKQVQRAIKEYQEEPSDHSMGFIVFTMQIALMGHIVQKGLKTGEELKNDILNHDEMNNLFNVNNN